jgi:flagellar secretion chaperone FliS
MNPSRPPINTKASKQYIAEQINAMTPMELLVKLYDVALASCSQKDSQRLSRALVELIAALNFEHRELAVGLFRLYNYCLRNAKMGRFDLVQPILADLRDTWKKAMEQQDQKAQDTISGQQENSQHKAISA